MRAYAIVPIASLLLNVPLFAETDKSHEVVGSEAKIIAKTTKTMVDKPFLFANIEKPEITMIIVTMQPDGHTSLHKHPSPTFGYVLEGYVEVCADSVITTVKAGEAFFEPIDSPMQIWNTSDSVSKILINVIGSEGKPISIPVK